MQNDTIIIWKLLSWYEKNLKSQLLSFCSINQNAWNQKWLIMIALKCWWSHTQEKVVQALKYFMCHIDNINASLMKANHVNKSQKQVSFNNKRNKYKKFLSLTLIWSLTLTKFRYSFKLTNNFFFMMRIKLLLLCKWQKWEKIASRASKSHFLLFL